MKVGINATIEHGIVLEIKSLAESEQRSFSNMLEVLITFALNKKNESRKSNVSPTGRKTKNVRSQPKTH